MGVNGNSYSNRAKTTGKGWLGGIPLFIVH
jgi:hypothetical protein